MKLSIVLPTYREAENLKILLPQLVKKFNPYEIIIVDDNSEDGTDDISPYLGETHLKTMTRKKERGIGSALALGYSEAEGDVVLSLDADLSMNLDDVPKLLAKLNDGYDIVVGSRYIPGGRNRKEAFLPRMASIFGNWVFDRVFKLPVHDVSMNFRVLKKSIWEDIRTEEKDNVMLLEMLVNAKKKGYKIAEVPTVFGNRTIGESKTNIWKLIPRYIKFTLKI